MAAADALAPQMATFRMDLSSFAAIVAKEDQASLSAVSGAVRATVKVHPSARARRPRA